MNLAEDFKVVQGYASTLWGALDGADWVEMKNAHKIHTIINTRNLTTLVTLTPKVASDVAGTGSSAVAGGCKWWTCNAPGTLDRFVASTSVTTLATTDGAGYGIHICTYDPAQAASSNDCFTMGFSSQTAAGTGTLGITYIIEPRYKGYQAIIATTSST